VSLDSLYGIDITKDKKGYLILSSKGVVLADVFTILNNTESFDTFCNHSPLHFNLYRKTYAFTKLRLAGLMRLC